MATHTDHPSTPLVGRLEALTALAIVGVLGLALGLAALVMPATKTAPRAVSYRQAGTFSYSASASKHSVYGAGGVQSGDPIATDLVKQVGVHFRYNLRSKAAVSSHGTTSLLAQVKLNQGLTRRFVIAHQRTFKGASATATGTLPVSKIMHFVSASSSALSPDATLGATVSIIANVKTVGTIDGHALSTTYTPTLPFTLSSGALTLGSGSGLQPSGSTASLTPSRVSTVKLPATAANTIKLAVARPTVRLAREIGLGIAAVCLLLALFVARPLLRRGATSSDRDRVRALYGSLLVPVENLVTPGAAVAEVSTMGALAEIAKRYECMIMHSRKDDRDEYMVWDNGILYRRTVLLTAPDAEKVPGLDRTTAAADEAPPRVIVLPDAGTTVGSVGATRRGLRREPRRVSV